MTRRVLVTGATGFIGVHLCRRLVAMSDAVVVVTRRRRALGPLHTLGLDPRLIWVEGDVRCRALLLRVLNEHGITDIVHLAGQALPDRASKSPMPAFEGNISGTWAVLDAARTTGLRGGMVLISTAQVYGAPPPAGASRVRHEDDRCEGLGPYAASKRCAETLALSYRESYGLPVVSLRLANVYGPLDPHRSRLVPHVISRARGRMPISIHGDGSQMLDLVYIDDVVDGLLDTLAHARTLGRPVYNLGSGRASSISDVLAAVAEALPWSLEIRYGAAAARATNILHVQELSEATGFLPRISLKEGIRRTVALETELGW